MAPKRDRWSWVGIWLVGITAAAWSFNALSDLATLVGVTATIRVPILEWTLRVSWGLPVTVDVFAVIATRMWLRGTAPAAAVTYAQRAAWAAIIASVVGNAYHGWLSGDGRLDGVIVSAVPAVAIGALVHLAVLAASTGSTDVTNATDDSVGDAGEIAGDPPTDEQPATVIEHVSALAKPPARVLALAKHESDLAKARRLLADGAGSPTLADELGISPYYAKQLVKMNPNDVTADLLVGWQAKAGERRQA